MTAPYNRDNHSDQVDFEINQGTGIQTYTNIHLLTTKELLKEPKDYAAWKCNITEALQVYQLTNIIDKTISRPKDHSENGMNWMHTSLCVGEWLKHCLHPKLRERIFQIANLRWADDVYEAIEKQMEGWSPTDDTKTAEDSLA